MKYSVLLALSTVLLLASCVAKPVQESSNPRGSRELQIERAGVRFLASDDWEQITISSRDVIITTKDGVASVLQSSQSSSRALASASKIAACPAGNYSIPSSERWAITFRDAGKVWTMHYTPGIVQAHATKDDPFDDHSHLQELNAAVLDIVLSWKSGL